MDIRLISDAGAKERSEDELGGLLADASALTWVDIPTCDEHAVRVLSEVFGFHPIALRDCVQRNHVSKVHVYGDHVFTVLHAPQIGTGGHVHYIELDQFIGPNYLVTVHGPLNPVVDPEVALLDTRQVLRRIEQGHLRPQTPFDLSHAIVSALTHREADLVARLAQESGRMEQRVMLEEIRDDPEAFVEDLFRVWYELLAIRTMAAHCGATYGRMIKLARYLPAGAQPLVADNADQFETVKSLADGQREFLHGVIEFYQTRIHTHMTLAAEELAATAVRQNDDMRKISAWVAIIAVPTAVTGFFGMNVPYPGFGAETGFLVSAVIMVVIAVTLYVVFKRLRWL